MRGDYFELECINCHTHWKRKGKRPYNYRCPKCGEYYPNFELARVGNTYQDAIEKMLKDIRKAKEQSRMNYVMTGQR